jgi:hypothetical protein
MSQHATAGVPAAPSPPPSRRPALLGPAAAVLLAAALAPALPATAWDVDPRMSRSTFEEFHRRLATSVYAYPRHGAAPLGLVGFDVYADLTADDSFADEPFADEALDGDLEGDLLLVGRVGARKGLPGGIDLGASYAVALGGDLELVSGELQWAWIDGGLVTPSLALRVTATRTLDAGVYDLDQYGAELLLSKGFAVVTPYVGAGAAYSEGTLDAVGGERFEADDTRFIAYAGITVSLLIPKITLEVEQGDELTGALRVAFGF